MATHFKRKGKRLLGVGRQDAIRYFFGGNAMVSILVLGAICGFLLREAVLFFPSISGIWRFSASRGRNMRISSSPRWTNTPR